MTLPAFDTERHHIGVGTAADALKGFLVSQMTKRSAYPSIEKARDVGTDDLLGVGRHNFWTQSDYSGGEFQQMWGDDPAMFSDCLGMIPNQLARSVLSIAPIQDAVIGVDYQPNAGVIPLAMDNINGNLNVVFNNAVPATRVYRFTDLSSTTPTLTDATPDLGSSRVGQCAAWNTQTERLWIGTDAGSGAPVIKTWKWVSDVLTVQSTLNAPSRPGDPVTSIVGIHHFGPMRIVATRHGSGEDDDHLWLYKTGTGGSTKWDHIGILPGRFVKAVTYNSAVYILCRNGWDTCVAMTQGDQVFAVTEIPYAFEGRSMIEYAGRLYIGGVAHDLDGGDEYGELHELTGTSLRLVRTFGGEVYKPDAKTRTVPPDPLAEATPRGGAIPAGPPVYDGGPIFAGDDDPQWTPGHPRPDDGFPHTPKKRMRHFRAFGVAQGLLWMPDDSYTGLEVYDATTDGFFGASRLGTGDSDIEWTGMIPFGGSLYLWGSSSTAGETGLYRVGTRAETLSTYNVFLTTSDFAQEPGRKKAWGEFVTVTRGHIPWLEWSVDGGDTWTEVAAFDGLQQGDRYETRFDLVDVPASRQIRLRINFSLMGTADEVSAELLAHTLSFLVLPDRRVQFAVSIPAVDEIELPTPGESQAYDPREVKDFFWLHRMAGTTLFLQDVDDRVYRCVITALDEARPVITKGNDEGHLSLTFTEV